MQGFGLKRLIRAGCFVLRGSLSGVEAWGVGFRVLHGGLRVRNLEVFCPVA